MTALEVTADPGGIAVVALLVLALLALVGLFWRRTGRITSKLGTLEVGVEQINAQVNHVDPDREPRLRDLVVGTHELLTVVRQTQRKHGRDLAETRALIETHLAAHRAQDDTDAQARAGLLERRQPD